MTNVIPFKKKDAAYYFAGTSHLFDKGHVIESYNKLKALGPFCADMVRDHVKSAVSQPTQYADPASRLKTMAALLVLFEWKDSSLFRTIQHIFQDEFALAEDILTADFIAYLPQILIGVIDVPQLWELVESENQSEIMRASAIQGLVTVSLEGQAEMEQVRDVCWRIWSSARKSKELVWMAALEGSLILGDKMRIPAILKALQSKHIEAENRERYLEIVEALQHQAIAHYLENMRQQPHLQSKVDVEGFFSHLSLFHEIETVMTDEEGPDANTPTTVYTLEVSLQKSDFKSTLTIADSATFEDLHEGILASVGWKNDRAYAFYLDDIFHSFDEIVVGGSEDLIPEDGDPGYDTFVWEKNLTKGQTFSYIFDLSDEQRFRIKVKEVRDVEELAEFTHFVYSVDSYAHRPDTRASFDDC